MNRARVLLAAGALAAGLMLRPGAAAAQIAAPPFAAPAFAENPYAGRPFDPPSPAGSPPSAFPARYGAVAVDVGPLRARGLGPVADAVQGDLAAALRAAFADRLGAGRGEGRGGGPRLVVRITGLSLNAYAGSESRPSRGVGSGTNSDYLEGEALVLDRAGAVIARHPQLSALPASYGGPWYDPASERRRVTVLAEHYARWLRRTLGGG